MSEKLKTTTPKESSTNTDNRELYDWKSKWCEQSKAKIKEEAIWIAVLFFLSLMLILLIWNGFIFKLASYGCDACSRVQFDRFASVFVGGLFGGVIFGLKYLYKVVARGGWHEDRRLWRIFSPWLSAGVALSIGALFDSGVIGLSITAETKIGFFAIGFVTGYFADRAIAKMQEVAETLFGSPNKG